MKTKIITIALVSLSFLSIDMYCQEIETKIIGEVVGRDCIKRRLYHQFNPLNKLDENTKSNFRALHSNPNYFWIQ